MSESFDRPTEPIEQPAASPPPPPPPAAEAGGTAAGTPAVVPTTPVTVAPAAVGRPTRSRGWIDILLAVAAVVAVAGIAFAIGRMTAPATAQVGAAGGQFPGGQLPGQGQGNRTFGNGGFPGAGQGNNLPGGALLRNGAIKGEVVEITSDHITLKLASGQQISIPLDSSTTYHRQTSAAAGDVTSGSQVLVELAPRATAGNPSASPNSGTNSGRLPTTASDITVVTP